MKKHSEDEKIALELYQTLKDEGMLPPSDVEDIEVLEEEFGKYPAPTFDIDNMVQSVLKGGSVTRGSDETVEDYYDEAVYDSLAMAARNGGELSPEVRAKMDADRQAAEKQRDNGS